ncbi:MAG: class I SAM-dependent methyltransferase [Candidatus Bathycorpusculaceae bacterium]
MVETVNPLDVVLDLICGGGYPSRDLARNHKHTFVVGADVSRECLDFAKKAVKSEGLRNVQFVCCDVKRLPFRNDSADVSFVVGGIEYLDNPTQFLKEVKRVTRRKLVLTFTSEKFKKKIHYKLGLVHLRYLLAKKKTPKTYNANQLQKILDDTFRDYKILNVGHNFIVETPLSSSHF